MRVYFQRTWIEIKNLDRRENVFNCSGSALFWYYQHWQRFGLPHRLPSRFTALSIPHCHGILLWFPEPRASPAVPGYGGGSFSWDHTAEFLSPGGISCPVLLLANIHVFPPLLGLPSLPVLQ